MCCNLQLASSSGSKVDLVKCNSINIDKILLILNVLLVLVVLVPVTKFVLTVSGRPILTVRVLLDISCHIHRTQDTGH